MSDLHAQFKQIEERRKALEIDINAAEASGADKELVKRARGHLKACMWLVAKGIGKGMSEREFKRVHGVELPND